MQKGFRISKQIKSVVANAAHAQAPSARTHTRATMNMLSETHNHYQGDAECIYWVSVRAASNALTINATLLLQRKQHDNAT